MGTPDSVMVPCPKCGELHEAQSKSGPCTLDLYTLLNAPESVLADVNRHAPFKCPCGAFFRVDNALRVTETMDGRHKSPLPLFAERAKPFLEALDALTQRYGVHLTVSISQGDAALLLVDGYKSTQDEVTIYYGESRKKKP